MKSFAKLLILLMASSAAALSVFADEVIQYNLTPEKVGRVKLLESRGKSTILIELVDVEKQAFSELTQRHIGQNLQIVYGERILVQAAIRAEIDSGIIWLHSIMDSCSDRQDFRDKSKNAQPGVVADRHTYSSAL